MTRSFGHVGMYRVTVTRHGQEDVGGFWVIHIDTTSGMVLAAR